MERFWSKVERAADDECWIWTACLIRGYGQFALPSGRRVRAHRLAYELLVGPIPEGLELDHLCRNTRCVNPAHLEPVTGRVNWLRSAAVTAINARKTHCVNGHEFTPENIYPRGKWRECRTCARARGRARKRRMKAARDAA